MSRLWAPLLGTAVAGLCVAAPTEAASPYVIIEDADGLVAGETRPGKWQGALLTAYAETGAELPEVLSVWSTFPMGGNNFGTIIDPLGNDVEGIGLLVKDSAAEPVQAILWHNNFLALAERADFHGAPLDGYGRYLFLLELSHLWGPQARVPDPNPGELRGFPYHWSFFLTVPGPAGGNTWTDNTDGTFTVVAGDPATLGFSMLDLYLMGLAEPEEVPAFSVLTDVIVPPEPTDPFWGGAHSAKSFPWFDADAEPIVVAATPRDLTIDDVVAANGPRSPAAFTKTEWSVGFVLLVPSGTSDTELEEWKTAFDPFVSSLAPAFADATMDRGSLAVVTELAASTGGAGGGGVGGSTQSGGGDGGEGADEPNGAAPGNDDGGCSCRVGAEARGDDDAASHAHALWALTAASLVAARRRRRRSSS